jgi:hypothetical protein
VLCRPAEAATVTEVARPDTLSQKSGAVTTFAVKRFPSLFSKGHACACE